MISLDLERVSRSFSTGGTPVHAVENVSVHVEPGSFTAIVGASGCGKTTLLRLIAGLIDPDGGRITFGGRADPNRRHHAALVFQDARLLPWLTVEKNLLLALRHEHDFRARGRERVRRALELVGMRRWISAYPYQLSGGMAQRVNLARALCQNRDLWLLDEPFSALDAINRRQLQEELSRIWETQRPTVLLVTHDVTEAILLSDRILTMTDGKFTRDRAVDVPRPRVHTDIAFVTAVAETHASLV